MTASEFLRLAEKPGLIHPGYPICDACNVETNHEDNDWLCPSCGTVWPGDDLEAPPEKATMYHEWSGVDLIGPICPNDQAWRVGGLYKHPEDRDRIVNRIIKEGKRDHDRE